MNVLDILNKQVSSYEIEESDLLFSKIDYITDINVRRHTLRKVIELNPNNSMALIILATLEFGNNDSTLPFILLEKAFSSDVSPILELTDIRLIHLLGLLARYKIEEYDHDAALTYLHRLEQVKRSYPSIAQEIQLATLITGYPKSVEDARDIITNLETRIDTLLQLDNIDTSYIEDRDPYTFCLLSFFNLEIYHECNIKSLMKKHYELTIKAFPHLIYTTPHLTDTNNELFKQHRKHKIGIVSAFFSEFSSVLLLFKGIINNLLIDKYDITFIYINEKNERSDYLENKENVMEYTKSDNWLDNARKDIGELDLDILFYLDSTMSGMVQRLLISKLARKQIVSYGHPITSGVDNSIMDYYISWAGAELEYEKAQEHYTEKLILVPETTIDQYFIPVSRNNISCIDNQPFGDITRSNFEEYVPSYGNWYLCMQKPFKRHPEFDHIVKAILDKDQNGRVLLHGDNMPHISKIMEDRFINIGVDITRIHFIPCQPHHRLMGLYMVSDVILDSYYAGGCTTTREAFEVGGAVVTLPTDYLGGRWTYAYYNIIGIRDMIAETKEEYVDIAVKLGTNTEYNNEMKTKILDNVGKLHYQQSALDAWDKIFMDILDLC